MCVFITERMRCAFLGGLATKDSLAPKVLEKTHVLLTLEHRVSRLWPKFVSALRANCGAPPPSLRPPPLRGSGSVQGYVIYLYIYMYKICEYARCSEKI